MGSSEREWIENFRDGSRILGRGEGEGEFNACTLEDQIGAAPDESKALHEVRDPTRHYDVWGTRQIQRPNINSEAWPPTR